MDPLQILQSVNAFYENAFSHLLTFTLIILGFGGVVLPIVVQIIQLRSLKTEAASLDASLKADLKAAVNSAKQEITSELELKFASQKDQLQADFKRELNSFKANVNEQLSVARAGTFYVQGAHSLQAGDFAQAGVDYAGGSGLFISGKDYQNGQRGLRPLIDACLPQLNHDNFENEPLLDREIDKLLSILSSHNEHGRFADDISSLRKAWNQAKKRNLVAPQPTTSAPTG